MKSVLDQVLKDMTSNLNSATNYQMKVFITSKFIVFLLSQRSAHFLHKGPDNKYLMFYGP